MERRLLLNRFDEKRNKKCYSKKKAARQNPAIGHEPEFVALPWE